MRDVKAVRSATTNSLRAVAPAFLALAVIGVILASSGSSVLGTSPSLDRAALSLSPRTAAGPAGSSAVASAESSLSAGAGPAAGGSWSCANSGGGVGCAPATAARPATSHTSPNWTRLPTSPGGRFNAAMTYDQADNEVVLFGGDNSSIGILGDTWVYKNTVWSPLNLSVAPPPLEAPSMAYDFKDRYVVLFGGYATAGDSSATWKFVHNTWTKLSPATHPPAVYGANLAWDVNDSYLVLFGGGTSSGTYSGATWTFVGGSWTQLTPTTHPTGRVFASMAYDNGAGWILLYGGYNGTSGTTFGDTWNFSKGHWTKQSPATSPPALSQGVMTNDSSDNEVLLFGGATLGPKYLAQTWAYANGTWTHLTPATPPSSRYAPVATYDKAIGKVVLFGGFHPALVGPSFMGDLWTFHANVWAHVLPAAPSIRSGASMVYDEADGYVLLFGGAGTSQVLNDTWTYLHGKWTHLKTPVAPVPRYFATMAYDAGDGYVVLFGGLSSVGNALNDTWTFSAGKWTELSPALSPSARYSAAMVYDAADGYVLLTGGYGPLPGYSYDGDLNDTWTFSGGVWTDVVGLCPYWLYSYIGPCSARPIGAVGYTLVYDAADGYTLLYGGLNYTTDTVLSQIWAWYGGTWYDLAGLVSGTPGPLVYAAATYDSTDGYVLVQGGANASLYVQNSTWAYSSGAWTKLSPAAAPPEDAWASMAYDAADSEVVYLPGFASVSGTWLY